MLKNIDPLLTADLLYALASMGHGDVIALVDANYPATRSQRLIEVAGAGCPALLRAVLTVFPIDSMISDPVVVMQVVGDPGAVPPVVAEMNAVLAEVSAGPAITLERHGFYAAAERAYAVVLTGERRFYGNVLLTKGVIPPAVEESR